MLMMMMMMVMMMRVMVMVMIIRNIVNHFFFVFSQSPEASNIPDPNSNNSQACLIADRLVDLWRDFHTLMLALRANPEDANYMTPETFHHHARQWAINFRCVTFDEVSLGSPSGLGLKSLLRSPAWVAKTIECVAVYKMSMPMSSFIKFVYFQWFGLQSNRPTSAFTWS